MAFISEELPVLTMRLQSLTQSKVTRGGPRVHFLQSTHCGVAGRC